jgi:hypothetical protein
MSAVEYVVNVGSVLGEGVITDMPLAKSPLHYPA